MCPRKLTVIRKVAAVINPQSCFYASGSDRSFAVFACSPLSHRLASSALVWLQLITSVCRCPSLVNSHTTPIVSQYRPWLTKTACHTLRRSASHNSLANTLSFPAAPPQPLPQPSSLLSLNHPSPPLPSLRPSSLAPAPSAAAKQPSTRARAAMCAAARSTATSSTVPAAYTPSRARRSKER